MISNLIHNDSSKSFDGIVLIPDISGFTKFVSNTEFEMGKEITRELLSTIIDYNIHNFEISEIEGDAILFYSRNAITPQDIRNQFEIMLEQFNNKLKQLKMVTGIQIDLTLKMIVHYGKIATYELNKFTKLYGKTVIEAHRLLKNSIKSKSYLLFTDNFLKASNQKHLTPCYFCGSQLYEIYGDLIKLEFTFFDYESNLKQNQVNDEESLYTLKAI